VTTTQKILLAAGISVVTTVLSLALVVVVVVKLPADYFVDPKRRHPLPDHPVMRVIRIVGKNLLGIVLVAVGIVMALPMVPGSGILTIFLGILLLDFPGKYRLERAMLRRPRILNALNGIRKRYGKEPLHV
jgi:hypothetical protein